jgi:hypothetical protein
MEMGCTEEPMNGFGQIIDDFPTPSGRYIVIWDLAAEESWYGLVQNDFKGVIGTLVAFDRSADGQTARVVAIDREDLPRELEPVMPPLAGGNEATGGSQSNLLLVYAQA